MNVVCVLILASSAALSGCSVTTPISHYRTSDRTQDSLSHFGGVNIALNDFTSSESDKKRVMITYFVGKYIAAPDEMTFAEYIQKAFIKELDRGGVYNAQSDVVLTGNIDDIGFNSVFDYFIIKLTITSNNSRSLTVTEREQVIDNKYYEEELLVAIQNLIGKAIRHEEFSTLLR